MSNASGQSANGLHFLSLAKMVFKRYLAGDVPVNAHVVDDLSGLVADRRSGGFGFVEGAVFFPVRDAS